MRLGCRFGREAIFAFIMKDCGDWDVTLGFGRIVAARRDIVSGFGDVPRLSTPLEVPESRPRFPRCLRFRLSEVRGRR